MSCRFFFFFKQKTAYEMRISDWSSDVCSSDLLWGQVRGEIEARYNNEPNWKAATSADYVALLGQAGFRDIAVGYQDATDAAARGNAGFGATSKGVFRSWAVMSAIR